MAKPRVPKEELKKILGEIRRGEVPSELRAFLDIPLKLTVELGRTKMEIGELLALKEGSIIELSTHAGDPVEILVNDKLVALGEVVVVDDRYGVRITSILVKGEKIAKLV